MSEFNIRVYKRRLGGTARWLCNSCGCAVSQSLEITGAYDSFEEMDGLEIDICKDCLLEFLKEFD